MRNVIFNSLLPIIQLWDSNTETRSQHEFSMNHADYLREFCTISLDTGRGSGKTSAIRAMLEIFHNSYAISGKNLPSFKRYLRPSMLGDTSIASNSIIFVDEPYKLFALITEDEFYQHMAFHKVSLIIMLGQK